MGSLAEALPDGIAKVSELIGRMEKEAAELDETLPGAGDGNRMVISVIRMNRDLAVAAQQSGDVVAMLAAYAKLKPSIELATASEESDKN